MRHHLLTGTADSAIAMFGDQKTSPTSDRLLAALQQAMLYRQMGEYAQSNLLLESAAQIADRRAPMSVSRMAGASLVSERLLEYQPSHAESVLISVYGMLNYLDLDDIDGAAVDARRVTALIEENAHRGEAFCRLAGTANYLAGLVFARSGDADDALISMRRAEKGFRECPIDSQTGMPAGLPETMLSLAIETGFDEVRDSVADWYPEASDVDVGGADIFILVENGFVAHRVGESIHVPIFDDDLGDLESGDSEGILEQAGIVAARLAGNLAERATWGSSWDDRTDVQLLQAFGGAHILKLAWPTLAAPPADYEAISLQVGGAPVGPTRLLDFSALAEAELNAERSAMLTRTIARGVVKYLLANEIETRAEEQGGELLGFMAGRLANLAANRIDEADTRSWSLLPAELSIVRVKVPAGEISVDVEAGRDGMLKRHVLGPFTVEEGDRRIVTLRLLSDEVTARPIEEILPDAQESGGIASN